MKHLTDIKQHTADDLQRLFKLADHCDENDMSNALAGKSAMALFFENSTRTLCSFQFACQRLGMHLNTLNLQHSSTQKGETLKDTILTLNAMSPDLFIVRHAENNTQEQISNWIDCPIINAGDGNNQHPTQGLLDLYTIRQHKSAFHPLKVTIIGDIKHSRVANSLMDGLRTLGCEQITLAGPDALIPEQWKQRHNPDTDDAIQDADVIVMLRIQKERLPASLDLPFDNWHADFGLNAKRLKLAKPDAIVMHPGPMNRGVEIDDEVADGPQSVILNQVSNGVLLRQAAILDLLNP